MKENKNIDEDIQEMIKEYSLRELKNENIGFEKTELITVKFVEYNIEGDYIIVIRKNQKVSFDDSELFHKEEKLSLIIELYNLGYTIYNNTVDILKYHNDVYMEDGRSFNKPSFQVNINDILENEKIYNKIIGFLRKYGIPGVDAITTDNINYKFNLKIFIRRLLDFFYTFNLWKEMSEKENISQKNFEEFSLIIDPLYRKCDRENLYQGVINNIQEKGLVGKEKDKHQVFEVLYYDKRVKYPQIKLMASDYITLAYYQLSRIIVNKPNGIPFKKCARPGCENFFVYKYRNKIYCEDPVCCNIRNTQKVQRFRERNRG